ncbi:unnamed protein product [Cuscuta epithymum]|uniref:RNase H type-1 domain-containing protein n=1 Tax=Cuscuta epithymum TaxID=186058 RepID=A0AAV0DNH8_9ASTE|nr:unnamed protein product [Cuscuta epithymum]
MVMACEMVMDLGYDGLEVEVDAVTSIPWFSDDSNEQVSQRFQTFKRRAKDKGLIFEHTLREGNFTAHMLAEPGIIKTHFTTLRQLPTRVKQCYYADLFGWPHFRI